MALPYAPSDYTYALREAGYALSGAAARDNLHLWPDRINRAAMARATRALKALEDFVRRILILLALELEHVIDVDISERPYPKHAPKPRNRAADMARGPSFIVFKPDTPPALGLYDNFGPGKAAEAGPVNTAPILFRIQRLKDIIDAPDARARRLAYTLARRRHGFLWPPGPHRLHARNGTNITTLYHAQGAKIKAHSRKRPPPQRPRPPPGPRIRVL